MIAGRKWFHMFENVDSILFTVDLKSYDQCLPGEELTHNLVMESLVLFDSIVNSRWFLRASIILMLCNLARFKEKLVLFPLKNYFPDYSGGTDVDRAVKYLVWRFNQANRADLRIYPHVLDDRYYCSATSFVFESVKDTIISNSLMRMGLV